MSFEVLLEQAETAASNQDLNAYYDGERSLDSVGISIPPRVRALEVVVNWTRLVVDTTAEVLTVEGFECVDAAYEDMELLRKVWQSSDMDSLSHLAHTEALVQGEAYVIVGLTENGTVRTTVHSRDGFAVAADSSGEITEALVRFQTENEPGSTVEQAAYYTRDSVEVFQQNNGMWSRVSSYAGCGIVPVIPLRNAARISDNQGRSEMEMVIPFNNSASRSFTLLQLATEIMSMPQRWIAGADKTQFTKPNGAKAETWEIYLGSLFTTKDENAKFGQFPGADLSQIINVIKTCATQVSAMTGIPPSMLGVTTENPVSAEAMRAAKERMISRCERKQQIFGDTWETWARVVLALQGKRVDNLETLQAVWRDVAVPSVSARSANLLQAHAQGVISATTARDGLPLTPEQRAYENRGEMEAGTLGASDTILQDDKPEPEPSVGVEGDS